LTTVKPFPLPPADTQVKFQNLHPGTVIYRVHAQKFGPTEFNGSGMGNARFSPIVDSNGRIIPTLYAASSVDAALMETVFHDVATSSGLKIYDSSKLDGIAYCQLTTNSELILAVLYGPPLRKLGINEGELIHSSAADYEHTRKWAMAIHAQHPSVQGLVWVSKQCSPDHAYLFFGDRCPQDIFNAQFTWPDLKGRIFNDSIEKLADEMGLIIPL